jgi:hypothetical protein
MDRFPTFQKWLQAVKEKWNAPHKAPGAPGTTEYILLLVVIIAVGLMFQGKIKSLLQEASQSVPSPNPIDNLYMENGFRTGP